MLMNFFRKRQEASKADPKDDIAQAYSLFREAFFCCYQGRYVDKAVLEDICQESFIALHKAIQNGKIQEGTPLHKYLFGIGRKMLWKYIEGQAKHPQTTIDDLPAWMDTDDSSEWMEMQIITREEVNFMEKICREVLDAYYVDRKNMQEIAEEYGYKNKQIAKNRKYLCLQELKKRLKERFSKEGLD